MTNIVTSFHHFILQVFTLTVFTCLFFLLSLIDSFSSFPLSLSIWFEFTNSVSILLQISNLTKSTVNQYIFSNKTKTWEKCVPVLLSLCYCYFFKV